MWKKGSKEATEKRKGSKGTPTAVETSPLTPGSFRKKKSSIETKDQDEVDYLPEEEEEEVADTESIDDDDLEPYFPEVEEEEHVIDPQVSEF